MNEVTVDGQKKLLLDSGADMSFMVKELVKEQELDVLSKMLGYCRTVEEKFLIMRTWNFTGILNLQVI